MTTKLTCSETAKLIRTALKESFNGVKFSVRSSTYAGGASVSVSWTDGPNSDQVSFVTEKFESSYFCGMTDYKGFNRHMMNGERINFGADSVFNQRYYSDSTIQKSIDAVFIKYKNNWESAGVSKPLISDFRNGDLYSVIDPDRHNNGFHSLQDDLHENIWKRSYCPTTKSKTLSSIQFMGDDGHGYNSVGKVKLSVVKS